MLALYNFCLNSFDFYTFKLILLFGVFMIALMIRVSRNNTKSSHFISVSPSSRWLLAAGCQTYTY